MQTLDAIVAIAVDRLPEKAGKEEVRFQTTVQRYGYVLYLSIQSEPLWVHP
jgi:hypothetical protein